MKVTRENRHVLSTAKFSLEAIGRAYDGPLTGNGSHWGRQVIAISTAGPELR